MKEWMAWGTWSILLNIKGDLLLMRGHNPLAFYILQFIMIIPLIICLIKDK